MGVLQMGLAVPLLMGESVEHYLQVAWTAPSMEWEVLMVRLCNYRVRIEGRAESMGSSR